MQLLTFSSHVGECIAHLPLHVRVVWIQKDIKLDLQGLLRTVKSASSFVSTCRSTDFVELQELVT